MGILDRLEVENFKSYKGSMVIGPFMGFTAVIGPNGSGKSNLMDAISFVLGEKTSSLRVKHVKDLIHGAPIGQPVANRARVTAVYKQDSGEEMHFSRTIVASSNSTEYRINGKTVTYANYSAQLESLGILIKAKNFLVFQGAVESIAMKTPKERTAMFEQISRSGELAEEYEEKRVAMVKAEDETNFAAHRKKAFTRDKREARQEKEEAEKYRKLQQDVVDAQLDLELFKLYHNEQEIDKLVAEQKSRQKDTENLVSRGNAIEQQLKVKKQEVAKRNRESAVVEKHIKELEADLNKKRPQYIKSKEKTTHLTKRLEQTKKSFQRAEAALDKHKQELAELEEELVGVQRLAQQYEDQVSEESQGQDLELLDSQVAEYHKLKEVVRKQTAALRQDLESIMRKQRVDESSLKRSQQKKKDLESRREQLREQRSQLEERVEKLDNYISTNKVQVAKLKEEHTVLEAELQQATDRHRQLNADLESVQEELRDAKVDKHDSMRQQKRNELLQNMKRLFPGVHGRLIDLCQPSHRRYALSVTKVLGRDMDSVVVEHEKTARDCIQYLKEQRGDPITFLPLDRIQVKPVNERLREIGGTAKLVIDVIQYEPPQVKRALQYACGNAVVCDTMEEARRLAFSGKERLKTVSLDGTLFHKSGVISGGAAELQQKARRWDEKQVDGLKRRRDELLEELKDLAKHRRKEPELQNLQSQLGGLETRLNYSQRDRDNTMNKTLVENAKELQVIERELVAIEPQAKQANAEIAAREKTIKEKEADLNKVEDKVFKNFCRQIGVDNIRQYEEKQLKGTQERANKRLEFSNQVSRLHNQLEYERKRDPAATVKKLAASLKSDEADITRLRKEEAAQLKVIDEATERLEEMRKQHEGKKKETDDQDVELKEIKKLMAANNKEVAAVGKQIAAVESKLDQVRLDRHGLLRDCKMSYIALPLQHGTMEDIANPVTSSQPVGESSEMQTEESTTDDAQTAQEKEAAIVIDYSRLKRAALAVTGAAEIQAMMGEYASTVADLQARLTRMAPPNMRAMDKLDGVQSKLQETTEEFEAARRSARKARAEFEDVKKRRFDRFNDAFQHVSQNIDEIYKSLSNTASAQAFLGPQNAEEPYLGGMDYNCIAPGKRFGPMDNLSGGEKTVAALALLFAIHSYQPSPFFVLDEIDAALDSTNIGKVTRYISRQTKEHFQCIVISLKEDLFSAADVLVGITAGRGDCTISEVLTIDLRKYDSQQ